MPLVEGKYVAQDWQNGGPPAIDADELNAMSQKLEDTYTKEETISSEVFALYGKSSNDIPSDILQILSKAVLFPSDGNLITPGGETIPQLKVVSGTYIGTGRYGANGPTSFNLPFVPSFVYISQGKFYSAVDHAVLFGAGYALAMGPSESAYAPLTVTRFDTKVSFYQTRETYSGARFQLNEDGQTYKYLAFSTFA